MSKNLLIMCALVLLLNSASVYECVYQTRNLTTDERIRVNELGTKIVQMDESLFYKYYYMCPGPQSRVDINSMLLVHETLPLNTHDLIRQTLHASLNRKNKCPKWSLDNVRTKPQSGSMSLLVVDESTPVGQVVYLLSAIDPEQKPLFYFIRMSLL